MNNVSIYFTKNKKIFLAGILWCGAVVVTLVVLTLLVGLMAYYFGVIDRIWTSSFLIYSTLFFISLMLFFICVELYVFRQGGHSFAQQLKARKLVKLESTPEEYIALKITMELARKFSIAPPAIYVLADEIGINALSVGDRSHTTVILLTWGAIYHLDELELYGLIAHEFQKILSGEVRQNTQLKILYSSLTSCSQFGGYIAKKGFDRNHLGNLPKFSTIYIVLGGIIWLMGSFGILMNRITKYSIFYGHTFKNDQKTQKILQSDANLQTLLRIYVHHAGSQIHSQYSEAISFMCYANSLSPRSWWNIHPTVDQRIFELDSSLIQELQLENLKKIRKYPLYGLFRSLEELDVPHNVTWMSPEPLPLLRLSPISFAVKDAIKPLNPDVRANMKRPELIQRALQTATGAREVMVAILMIRQYRQFIPIDAEVSRSIVEALLAEDGRVHISIFYEACNNIGSMPVTAARQFVTRLAKIIQADGEIGLLDALLLEKVKEMVRVLPIRIPTSFEQIKPQIVRLIDALLHVQQINSRNQLIVRRKILEQILNTAELLQYANISDEPIDLAEIVHDMAGLVLRDRLNILNTAEVCLWSDRIITQDELDVLELLYWRLGLDSRDMVEFMHKKNSVMII